MIEGFDFADAVWAAVGDAVLGAGAAAGIGAKWVGVRFGGREEAMLLPSWDTRGWAGWKAGWAGVARAAARDGLVTGDETDHVVRMLDEGHVPWVCRPLASVRDPVRGADAAPRW